LAGLSEKLAMADVASEPYGTNIRKPPIGFAVLGLVGPSMVWCAEYIGSGEVILAPRTGAILGTGVLWVLALAIFLKYWIGLCGARYTACTGEGMIDMFDRLPGPRHWAVGLVLVFQLIAATLSIGALANAAGFFVGRLIHVDPRTCAWLVALFALVVAWSGGFRVLKAIMSLFVVMIVLGALYIAVRVLPSMADLLAGFTLHVPQVPQWAVQQGASPVAWRELIPLMGWAAGGFASQVWYTYWVMGANYGAAEGRGYGRPADTDMLKRLNRQTAERIKGWCSVIYADATLALLIGLTVSCGFLIAGAGVLGPLEQVPQKGQVAEVLSKILSSQWGPMGGAVYLLAGSAALISTQLGQLAGWPRLLADCFRICIPSFNRRLSWKWQYRSFLLFFFCTNMAIVYGLGEEPVAVIQLAAAIDGVLLTSLQAVAVGVGLYLVMPRLLSAEAWAILKPHWFFAVILAVAAVVFGYVCLIQLPPMIVAMFG
jgi:Mn2+/Fe2+ NRAMP family transporter